MDSLKIFKEQQINNYLSSIDLSSIDVNILKRELKSLIGEEPAVKLNYVTDELIMENGSKGKKIERIESVSITYIIDDLNSTIPIPVTQTYIVS